MDTISELPLPQLPEDVKRLLLSQIGFDTSIVDIVFGRAPLLSRILEFTFIILYHANDKSIYGSNCTGIYTAVLKDFSVDCIIEKPLDEMKNIRQFWTSFCEECELSKERFLIFLSSAMYKKHC